MTACILHVCVMVSNSGYPINWLGTCFPSSEREAGLCYLRQMRFSFSYTNRRLAAEDSVQAKVSVNPLDFRSQSQNGCPSSRHLFSLQMEEAKKLASPSFFSQHPMHKLYFLTALLVYHG